MGGWGPSRQAGALLLAIVVAMVVLLQSRSAVLTTPTFSKWSDADEAARTADPAGWAQRGHSSHGPPSYIPPAGSMKPDVAADEGGEDEAGEDGNDPTWVKLSVFKDPPNANAAAPNADLSRLEDSAAAAAAEVAKLEHNELEHKSEASLRAGLKKQVVAAAAKVAALERMQRERASLKQQVQVARKVQGKAPLRETLAKPVFGHLTDEDLGPSMKQAAAAAAPVVPVPLVGDTGELVRAVSVHDHFDAVKCQTTNIVLNRMSNNNARNLPAARAYSVTHRTLAGFGQKECSSMQEIVDGINLGARHWEGFSSAAEPVGISDDDRIKRSDKPSAFKPAGCEIPVRPAQEIEAIMKKFDSITLLGDSLMRHEYLGLSTLLSGDLVNHGFDIVHLKDPGTHEQIMPFRLDNGFMAKPEHCQCDGAFTEVDMCRSLADLVQRPVNKSPLGPQTAIGKIIDYKSANYYDWKGPEGGNEKSWATMSLVKQSFCRGSGSGYKMLNLEGGIHYNMNAEKTQEELTKILTRLQSLVEECKIPHEKMVVMFEGFGTCSPRLEQAYPEQGSASVLAFNNAMAKFMHSQKAYTASPIHFVNWQNATRDAQQSDGTHFLTDVNIFKASTMLQVMKVASDQEGRQPQTVGWV